MFCSHCGTELKDGAQFCASCGRSIASDTRVGSGLGDRRGKEPDVGRYRKVRRYTCDPGSIDALVPALTKWLEPQEFDCQVLTTEEGNTLVQVSKRGSWRKLVGMSTALNVLFEHRAATLTVEIGAGRWLDKATAGAVSMLVPPLAVAAAIGAWRQIKLPEKVFAFIDNELGVPS